MNIIVVDTETTGLGAQQYRKDAIVQVGAVVVRDGNIIDEYNSCCWPGEEYFLDGRADYALEINSLSYDQLLMYPTDIVVADLFRNWISKYLPARITAFNVAFDKAFLDQKPWNLYDIEGLGWGKCIMLHAAEYLGEMGENYITWSGSWKWPKLEKACRVLDVDLINAHDAAGDARAAAEVMMKMGMEV